MTVRKQKKKIIKETERSKEKQKEKKAEKNNIKENKYIMKKLHTTQITNCQFFPNTFPTIVCASTRHKPSFSIRPAAAAATVRNHHFHHRALVPHWVLDAELVQKCVCVCVQQLSIIKSKPNLGFDYNFCTVPGQLGPNGHVRQQLVKNDQCAVLKTQMVLQNQTSLFINLCNTHANEIFARTCPVA